MASASMLWNIAQLPAGVVPVTMVRPGEARRDGARGLLGKLAANVDAQSAGLPVGAQLSPLGVVARPRSDGGGGRGSAARRGLPAHAAPLND
ncbi:MAG: hypothetical protein ABR567_16595 [Myxococcales bacterium]|nr:hypothetical protein [Myxococcales bacterium]